MKKNDEIRRANLETAIKRMRTAAKLAERIGTAPAYLSQIKNQTHDSKSGTSKTMGDDIARRIEVALGEPAGWMDADHTGPSHPILRIVASPDNRIDPEEMRRWMNFYIDRNAADRAELVNTVGSLVAGYDGGVARDEK